MPGKRVSKRRSLSESKPSRPKRRKVPSRRSSSAQICGTKIRPGFVVLDTPLKSPNDPKSYKIIQLQNGLRAILISDMTCIEDRKKVKRNLNCVDVRIEDFNKDVLGITGEVDCCGQMKKSQTKIKRSLTATRRGSSANKTVIRRHELDCDCDNLTAGIALSVGVGSLHDPKELPGLAHLMEHVVFCGSTKYPGASVLDKFLSENGGTYPNGSTLSGETLFYFGIAKQKLSAALDIFTSMFVSPRLTLEDIRKEREVVDAEFQDKRDEDLNRIPMLLKGAGRQDHPATKFDWGNRESLVTRDGRDETLQEILRQFLKQFYGAQNMTLAIQVPEPVEQIQDLVVEYFGRIPKSTITPSPSQKRVLPFDTPEFRRFYSVVSVNDQKQLRVTWELPMSVVANYRAMTFTYITRFIQNMASGSLVDYLRKRNLISGLECRIGGLEGSHYDVLDDSVFFQIWFTLIVPSRENSYYILEALFSYLKFLEKLGPQEWFFNELKSIQALNFHFLDDKEPIKNSHRFASHLRFYEPIDCLTGHLLPTQWDPKSTQAVLKMLSPSRANIVLIAKDLPNCNLEEPYFKTKYSVSQIPPEMLKRWELVQPFDYFKLCQANPFITVNFCCLEAATNSDLKHENNNRQCVLKNEKMEVWYLTDLTMKQDPESGYKMDSYSEYYLYLRTPQPLYTVQDSVMLEVWLVLLKSLLIPVLHGAVEAHLQYFIGRVETGLAVMVKGFSQKLNMLIEQILKHFKQMESLVNSDSFEAGKASVLQRLFITFKTAMEFSKQLRQKVLISERYWTDLEKYNALVHIQYEDFRKFCNDLTERMYAIASVYGNVNAEGALKYGENVLKSLKFKPLFSGEIPEIRLSQIPLGDTVLCARSINKNRKSSSIQCYYQVPITNNETIVLCELVKSLLEAPAFQELRANQNLGYRVSVTTHVTWSTASIIILVNCQSDKFSGVEIQTRIDAFVQEFYETNIKNLNMKDLLDKLDLLDDDERPVKIEVVDVQRWYQKFLLPRPGSEMRKLTTQVVGSHDTAYGEQILQVLRPRRHYRPEKLMKLETDEAFPLTILVPIERVDAERSNNIKYVRNINEFKEHLFLFPLK